MNAHSQIAQQSLNLSQPAEKYGVLIVNLGTPDRASCGRVRKFLGQFLSDKRVIDYPSWLWQPLLQGIILTFRPHKVARVYRTIWGEDSPLRVISYQQAEAVSERLAQQYGENIPVEIGMTYGNPSVESAMNKLMEQGVTNIVAIPMYPQYSATTSAASYDAIARVMMKTRVIPNLRLIRDYSKNPGYIQVLANSIKNYWDEHGKGEKLMFSFHGIPKRYVTLGDPYQAYCEQTANDTAEVLGLNKDDYYICYQSRVGKEEWLQPYTDKTLEELPNKGVKHLDLVCPAFSVDCLETLEEIAEENKEVFEEAGGEQYRYIPALNADAEHMDFITEIIAKELRDW